MNFANPAIPAERKHLRDPLLNALGCLFEGVVIGRHSRQNVARQVVADRVRNDEVAVCQPLHQRTRAEAVRAVIREVRFTQHMKARQGAHEVVIHPEAAHRVVNGRIDSHGSFIWVLTRYALVHVEKIAVALIDDLLTQTFDRLRKIQINAQAGSYTEAFVAYGFGIT